MQALQSVLQVPSEAAGACAKVLLEAKEVQVHVLRVSIAAQGSCPAACQAQTLHALRAVQGQRGEPVCDTQRG